MSIYTTEFQKVVADFAEKAVDFLLDEKIEAKGLHALVSPSVRVSLNSAADPWPVHVTITRADCREIIVDVLIPFEKPSERRINVS